MSKDAPEPELDNGDDDDDGPQWSLRAAAPFLIAFGVVAVLVIAVVLSGIFRPAKDRAAPSYLVREVIAVVYNSQGIVDWDDYRNGFCPEVRDSADFPSAEEFRTVNNRLNRDEGELTIDISDVEIDGDEATAKVTVFRAKDTSGESRTDVPTEVRKVDGDWKVCTMPTFGDTDEDEEEQP